MADTPEKTDEQTEIEALDTARQDLITRTQERLDAIAGIESVAGDAEPVVGDDKPKDDLASTDEVTLTDEDEDAPKDEVKDGSEGDEDPKAAEAGKEGSAEPTLPEAYRRSLKAYDWTDEEIDGAIETLGYDGFIKTAERIHRNRNVETAGYADAGRRARAGVVPDAGDAGPDKKTPGRMSPVDAAAVIEKYGNEELVNAMLSPVNDVIQQINTILPQLEKSREDAERTRVDTLGQQIETFFTAKEMKSYSVVYGDTTKAALTEVQQKNRNKVLEQADAVIIGAKLQGRQLTVEQGLLMAHDSVASEFKEQVIRKDIKDKTKKRAKSISVKPSHSGKPPASGKPSTRKQLEDKVAAGMKAVFGS